MDADEGMDAGLFQGSPQIIEMGGDDMQLALVPTGEDEDVQGVVACNVPLTSLRVSCLTLKVRVRSFAVSVRVSL